MAKQIEKRSAWDVTVVVVREPDAMCVGLAVCNEEDKWDPQAGYELAEWRARTPKVLDKSPFHVRIPYHKAPNLNTLERLARAQENTRDALTVLRMGLGISS